MKNRGQKAGPAKGYGPKPSASEGSLRLSTSRATVLELLRAQPEPTRLVALSAASGLHSNTLREHLDGLVGLGLARRIQERSGNRGRPAWCYEAVGVDAASGEYAGLAAALAAAIHNTDGAHERALAAGTEWGRDLARRWQGTRHDSDELARREVVGLFDELGFEPAPDAHAELVRLTRCPLLEAAHRYPDVVCGVHLGVVRGALEVCGADTEGTALFPFAEPGACVLQLVAPEPTD